MADDLVCCFDAIGLADKTPFNIGKSSWMKQLTFMVLLRRWTLAAGLGLFISGVFANSYTYTIDAQPLATALTHFAEQSELQILFVPKTFLLSV